MCDLKIVIMSDYRTLQVKQQYPGPAHNKMILNNEKVVGHEMFVITSWNMTVALKNHLF